MKKREESLQIAISTYIKHQYPDVIFTAESSGIRVGMGLAIKMKRQRCVGALPDLMILEPRGAYNGLMIELKTIKNTPFLKDGSLSQNQHVIEQDAMLKRLRHKGYRAQFCVGFDDAKKLIDQYMSQKAWDEQIENLTIKQKITHGAFHSNT